MSSRAMASPAPVLGDFTPTFRALAEEPLREDAVGAEAGFSSVFESKSFTASRTRDFRSCEEVGRTGPKENTNLKSQYENGGCRKDMNNDLENTKKFVFQRFDEFFL